MLLDQSRNLTAGGGQLAALLPVVLANRGAQIDETLRRYSTGNPAIVQAPAVRGIEDLTETSVRLLVGGRTRPMKQGPVARDLRLQVKRALDAAGLAATRPSLPSARESPRG